MLNKNQSHKRNSWKYAVVIPALIGFVFLFQVKVIAQEKSSSNKNEIIQTHEGSDVTFDSKETDKSLKTIKNVFKEENIVTDISKIKRNSDGDIIGIYIQMKSEDGRKKELLINQNSPIDRIMVYTIRLENGLYDFGIKHLNKKEVAAIRAEIHRKSESAYNSKNDKNTYTFNNNDSINVVGDFDFEIPELAELSELSEGIAWNSDDNSKIVIKRNGGKPLVIINGKVVGGEDGVLNKEELEELKNSIKMSDDGEDTQIIINGQDMEKVRKGAEDAQTHIRKMNPQIKAQVRRSMEHARKDMERSRGEMDRAREESDRSRPEMERAREEMIQAKEEMLKAKAEMEKAKAELEKAKADLKNKK